MNRVLLVNDNEPIMDRTAGMLETLGWEVSNATSREAALWVCIARAPRLAVVDIEMLGGDGFEMISTIRRTDKNVFILAVTRGRDDEKLRRVAEACGANQHVVGPVSQSKLSAAIEAGLDTSS